MTSPTQPATADSVKRAVLADAKRQRHIEAGRKLARVQQHEDPPPEVCRKRKRLEADKEMSGSSAPSRC